VNMSCSPESHAARLAEHARDVGIQINKFAITLTPETRTEATQKLSYGKQVLNSLNNLLANPSGVDPDLLYQVLVSFRPSLIVAIEELDKQLASNEYFQMPDPKPERPKTHQELLAELEAHFAQASFQQQVEESEAAYARAVHPGPPPQESNYNEDEAAEDPKAEPASAPPAESGDDYSYEYSEEETEYESEEEEGNEPEGTRPEGDDERLADEAKPKGEDREDNE
jgi:hypothetical protein